MMDPTQLQRLMRLSMPYGKYKGRLLADHCPATTSAGFAQGASAQRLGRLLALMHEIDSGLSQLLRPLRSAATVCPRARRATEHAPKEPSRRIVLKTPVSGLWRRNF